ncbi:MAG: Gfo/Idh/MocA family oxidoreductase [Clostridia bacterium]|nr:Gfo/Idh/MocA family oxidoreductase [Clostridia bacterium]
MKSVAIIGFGGQGNWHADMIRKNNVVSLAGVWDIRPERLAYAGSMGIRAYASREELLADPAVDIVLIATPNDLHKPFVIEALSRGKHVVCEKPVALSVSDYDEMTAAARAAGRVFEVHQNRRWDTDYLAVKDLIDSERLGKPLFVASYVQGSRGIPGDWRRQKEYGGGMIYDWGVHMIDQMLKLIPGSITDVFCLTTHYTNSEVDDGYRLYLKFDSGVLAYSEVGTYNFISQGRFYAQFETGTAHIPGWHDPVEVRECLDWGEGDVHPVLTASGITRTMAPRSDRTVRSYNIPQPSSDVHDFYRNLVEAIDGKAEKLIRDEEVRRVLSVIEAAFASADAGQVIRPERPL